MFFHVFLKSKLINNACKRLLVYVIPIWNVKVDINFNAEPGTGTGREIVVSVYFY